MPRLKFYFYIIFLNRLNRDRTSKYYANKLLISDFLEYFEFSSFSNMNFKKFFPNLSSDVYIHNILFNPIPNNVKLKYIEKFSDDEIIVYSFLYFLAAYFVFSSRYVYPENNPTSEFSFESFLDFYSSLGEESFPREKVSGTSFPKSKEMVKILENLHPFFLKNKNRYEKFISESFK